MYEEVVGKEEEFKLSKRLSAEAAKLTKLGEDRLYEMIGEALLAQELLKKPMKFLESEGIRTVMDKTRKADSRKRCMHESYFCDVGDKCSLLRLG